MWMKLFHDHPHIPDLSLGKVSCLTVGNSCIKTYLLIFLLDVCHSHLETFVNMWLQTVTIKTAKVIWPYAIDPCSIAKFNPSKTETNWKDKMSCLKTSDQKNIVLDIKPGFWVRPYSTKCQIVYTNICIRSSSNGSNNSGPLVHLFLVLDKPNCIQSTCWSWIRSSFLYGFDRIQRGYWNFL